MEFELAYHDSAVKRFNYYTMMTPLYVRRYLVGYKIDENSHSFIHKLFEGSFTGASNYTTLHFYSPDRNCLFESYKIFQNLLYVMTKPSARVGS